MKPVGWWNEKRRINWLDAVLETKEDGWNTPLYIAPRELSDEEIHLQSWMLGYQEGKASMAMDKAILKKASEK
jgi:hypothetical protein